ncbi:MAG TPA: NAD(P)/FAD-dependent oxidoreductase, partial [Telluria sp.]|nr:NAD(P)/FAD-dependent oxidoreductase [Telluria sp.]
MAPAPQYAVIVVGSGFGGLCMGVRLKQAGIDNFLILEKDSEYGGTWWANRYPGCAVDVPCHLYSFSFAPKPDWSRRYAPQQELLAYTRSVVRAFGLQSHLRLGCALLGAQFDEEGGYWTLQTSGGALTARSLVSCTGALSRPALPPIEGIGSFTGPMFHSSRWDHALDLRGKRVAVIGTGASAIQFVPEIAPLAAQLDVYQRSAPWILPRPDRAIGRAERRLLARVPGLQRLWRALDYLRHELRAIPMVYAPRMLAVGEWMARRHLARQVGDPRLRAALTPDYALGCKRILLTNTWYPALCRPNVTLLTGAIRAIGARGIVTAQGEERAVDVIVFGTGFDVEHTMGAIDLRGRGGLSLHATSDGALEAYKGCTLAGFPNFFMIAGPNTGLGHNSMIYMIE